MPANSESIKPNHKKKHKHKKNKDRTRTGSASRDRSPHSSTVDIDSSRQASVKSRGHSASPVHGQQRHQSPRRHPSPRDNRSNRSPRRHQSPRDRSNRSHSFDSNKSPRGSPGTRRRVLKSSRDRSQGSAQDIDSSIQRRINSWKGSPNSPGARSYNRDRSPSSIGDAHSVTYGNVSALQFCDSDGEPEKDYIYNQQQEQQQPRQPRRTKSHHGETKKSKKKSRSNKSYRSHSPVSRNRNNRDQLGNSRHKKKKTPSSYSDRPKRPKSENSLDVSKHADSAKNPVNFTDDTDIGRKKKPKNQQRRGRRQSTSKPSSLKAMESELLQMVGSMNGSSNFDASGTLDTTLNSKATINSKKTKKKKRGSKSSEMLKDLKKVHPTNGPTSPESPGKKAVRISQSPTRGEQELEGDQKPPRRTKSTKSSKSASSKKDKKKPKNGLQSPGIASGEESAARKKKTKKPSKAASEQRLGPPLDGREGAKKPKKKKRSSTKSPTRSGSSGGLPAVSSHSLPALSNPNSLSTKKGKKKTLRNTEVDPGENDKTSKMDNKQRLAKPGIATRSQSYDPVRSPGSLRRAVSARDELGTSTRSGASGGGNRLRRAKSLFGAVLNPNAKGAETVGDGDNSDNEYEIKNKDGKEKKGLLGWAKKKMGPSGSPNPHRSPGKYGKKRTLLNRRMGSSDLDDEDDHDGDHMGLLSNAEERGGQMSMLNLMVPNTDEDGDDNKKLGGGVGLDSIEDNTIEESNSFRLPINDAGAQPLEELPPQTQPLQANGIHNTNNAAPAADPRNNSRHSMISEPGDKPPFSQILSTADCADDDDLSDIGDPEANIVMEAPAVVEPELPDGGEIVYTPERNDIVYDDKGHPGTVRMIHVLREILVEHQDDIEYSPEVYKVIKRRLKGRKFLVRIRHNNRTAWREATKAENVKFLADFFHEEMRQLFGGSITITDPNYGDAEMEESVPDSPKRKIGGGNRSRDGSRDGAANLLQRAIAECKWAQALAKPKGDIETMNIGIDAEEKLISLIEIAEAGNGTEELKEELDKLGELAKQMMYVSIAPLYERLEEIEENMADYFDQEGDLDSMDEEEEEEAIPRRNRERSNSASDRDRSMEKDGEMYVVPMQVDSYEEENFFDDEEQNGEDEEEGEEYEDEEEYEEEEGEDEEEEEEEEFEEESDEESGTNVKEGEQLICENTDGDVSSVGESGIYDESESEDGDSELGDGEDKEWVDFGDDDSDEEEESHTEEGANSSDEDSDVSDEPIRKKKTIFDGPNPKMKQFFDRLTHLFETRKRIEECAASKDPGNKTRKIKSKTHSGGISKKSGAFKQEFQQRDTNGQVVRNLDDLYGAARAAYSDFKSIVQQLVDEISGLDYKKNIILPELKSRDRAYEKAKSDYSNRDLGPPESWLYDICRASIVCSTVKQLSEVSKWLVSNSNVVQAKNRFADPVYNGYRDLLYHVSIPYQDGKSHICEVQVHLKAIYDLNDKCGTIKHYDYFRSEFSNPWRSQEDALSDLEKMNKYTKIEGPFMKHLLKSEDPEQILLFAGILRDKLEEYDRSLELYRRVLGLQEEAHGSDNPEMADTYLSIGLVLGAMGDTDESLQNLLKALAIQESFLGEDHVEVADSYVEIGHMLSKRGDYSGAYTQYQRTQLIRENKFGKEHFLVIKSLQDIGLVLQKKGDFEESEKEYRKALAIQKNVLGEDHMDVATTHSYIGKTLCLYGDFEKAMVEDKLTLSMREKSLGKNHRSTADSHTAIGVLLFHKGDYKTSRWHHNKALKIRESMLGKNDEECAISHRHLGELLSYSDGDYEGAVKELKRGQEILEANVGMDHPVTANSYIDLGHIHCRHGKHEEALAEYRRAKVILESNLGQTHPDTAATYLCTGNALNLAGDQDGALQMHRKALVVFESVLGNSHPLTADGYQSTGDVFTASGHPEMALSEHREALNIRKSVLRKDHPSVAESCSRIGNILLTGCDGNGDPKQRDPQGALDIYREALAITEERCGKDHPAAAVARFNVCLALTALANTETSDAKPKLLDEAEEKLRSTLEILREVEPLGETKPTKSYFLGFGDEAAITGRACAALGTVLEQKGNDEGAREMFVEGLERLIKVLGGDHPETLEAESKLLSFVTES